MKIRFNQSKKRNLQHGQGMVEFALAFPIFLVLVIGIMEFGRLLVTYSSVYVAAREGARHGAAVENLPACGGDIEAEAERVGFLAGDMTVFVSYDSGPGTATKACGDKGANLVLGDRVNVTASTSFTPVTGIVPGFTVSSTASRTIIKKAYIEVAGGAPDESEVTEEPGEEPTEEETEEPTEEPTEETPPAPTEDPTLTPTPEGNCNKVSLVVNEQSNQTTVNVALDVDNGANVELDHIIVTWTGPVNLIMVTYTLPNTTTAHTLWLGPTGTFPFSLAFDPIPLPVGVTNFKITFDGLNFDDTNVTMEFVQTNHKRCKVD